MNIINIKIFLILVVFSCIQLDINYCQAASALPEAKALSFKKIVLEDLHLCKILLYMKASIEEVLSTSELQPEIEVNLNSALNHIEEALRLTNNIVIALKKQRFTYNPEIEYQFLKMCGALNNTDPAGLKPHHIRLQYESIKKFNQHITFYYMSRKNFLSDEDIALFNDISRFNYILMTCLLREDLFDISLFDDLKDYLIYRPYEWMEKHPWLAAFIGLGLTTSLGYLVYQRMYANPYNVVNLQGILQRGPGECGVYSVLHAIALNNAQNEQEAQAILNRLQNNNNAVDIIRRQVMFNRLGQRDQNTAEWLRHEEIQELLADQNFINRVAHSVGINQPIDGDQIVVIQNPSLLNVGGNELTNNFCDGVQRLRDDGRPHTVVMYVGNYSPNAQGHWLTMRIYPDNQQYGGIRPWVINSTPRNLTNNDNVRQLLSVYDVHNDIPSPGSLRAFERIGTDGYFNDDAEGTLEVRSIRSLRAITEGCINLSAGNLEFFRSENNRNQIAYCQDRFNFARNFWLTRGIQRIDIPREGREPHQLDFTQCANFDQFLLWLGTH